MTYEVSDYVGDCWANCLAIFGFISAAWLSSKLISSLWRGMKTFVFSKILGLSSNVKHLGRWAVVTGATDGIGKGYANELARRGMDLVLVSRNPDKLSDVAMEIEKQHKVKIETVAVDFTLTDIYGKIGKVLTGKDIGVLVNNVGMGYDHPDYFLEAVSDKETVNLINCNVTSVAMMTRLVLPIMVEKKQGAIINISSASAVKPTALLTHYGATKGYVDMFSEALQNEYKSRGITVQCVRPFLVATKLSKIRRTSFMVPSPTNFARAALDTVGLQQRTYGCLSHAIQGWIAEAIPDSVYFYFNNKIMLATRKRALRKK